MSDSTEPKSEALKQLEEQAALLAQQQAIAESEKAIAAAKKGKLAAELPAGAAAPPPDGSTTTDDKFGYLAELVAYDTLTRQADRLAAQVEQANLPASSKLLLVADLDMAAGDVQLLQVRQQLTALAAALQTQIETNEVQLADLLEALTPQRETFDPQREVLEGLQPKGITRGIDLAALATGLTPTLAATTALVGGVANIANMFRVDYSVEGQVIALTATTLQALVAGRVKKWPIYLPQFARISESHLLTAWSSLAQQQRALQNQLLRLRWEIIEPLGQRIAAVKAEVANLPDVAKVIKEAEITQWERIQAIAETVFKQTEALLAAFDESGQALMAIPEGASVSPLVKAILRERIDALGITHLLYATIVSSGGEAITSKRWFTSGHTAFLGGSVVSYLLADLEGAVIVADTLVEAGRLEYQLGSTDAPAFQGGRTA